MQDRVNLLCEDCRSTDSFVKHPPAAADDGDHGYFFCANCSKQIDDLGATAPDNEELYNRGNARAARQTYAVDAERAKPGDKELAHDAYSSCIRSRYLTGLQRMIELQCEALVEKCNVSPIVAGLFGPIWLRYLASTGVMADDWAEKVVLQSESQVQGEVEEFDPTAKFCGEPVNVYRKRLVMIWYRSLTNRIPISCSLVISFLVCHLAREAILPTDILKWAHEGKLPYLAAFKEIDKHLGPSSKECPINASCMFRPVQVISTQKLEAEAANLANRIGLDLPPVNFYAIASRYCRQLRLPSMKILPTACQIWEWCMPPELYLSANEFRIPTRAYVISILIVAVRILYDINGYGFWESSLSNPNSILQCHSNNAACADESSVLKNSEPCGTASEAPDAKLNIVELLQILEADYSELDDLYDFCKDLPTYIQYCKDEIFSGLHPSFEKTAEGRLVTELWGFYDQKNKVLITSDCQGADSPQMAGHKNKRSRKVNKSDSKSNGELKQAKFTSDCYERSNYSTEQDVRSHKGQGSTSSSQHEAIRQMKLEMEENKFCYVAPRTNVKRKDYLHYTRRRKDVYVYAVHADYYILLRSCAKVAQVETRVMHSAVLSFEKRLNWLEKKMDESLNLKHNSNDYCEFCLDEEPETDVIESSKKFDIIRIRLMHR